MTNIAAKWRCGEFSETVCCCEPCFKFAASSTTMETLSESAGGLYSRDRHSRCRVMLLRPTTRCDARLGIGSRGGQSPGIPKEVMCCCLNCCRFLFLLRLPLEDSTVIDRYRPMGAKAL